MRINSFAVHTAVVSATLIFQSIRSSAMENTNEWRCEVAGLRIVAPAWEGKDYMRAFNWSSGVTVALLLTAPTGRIVRVNPEASRLVSFADDKGTDLLADASRRSFTESFSGFHENYDAKSAVLLEVRTPARPDKGASELRISGKVTTQIASQTKQVTAENVELKSGVQFDLGDLRLTISAVQASGGENTISFEAKQSLSHVPRLEFFDGHGIKIESSRSGRSSSNSGSKMSETWSYTLKTKTDRIKIVATVWTDLKTIEVPVSIKTGIGL
jgi:hypothetical protein